MPYPDGGQALMGMLSFRDSDLRGAMAQVRATLGDEALIVSTRWTGGVVEVTASLDPPEPPSVACPTPEPDHAAAAEPNAAEPDAASATAEAGADAVAVMAPRPTSEQELWPFLEGPEESDTLSGSRGWATARAPDTGRIHIIAQPPPQDEAGRLDLLAWHGVPPPLARRLRAGPLPFALSINLRFGRLDMAAGAAPIIVVGPPGAGKTLTVARLATRLVRAGQRPLVICADNIRAGATEQLGALTRLLGLHLVNADDPDEAATALRQRDRRAPVLVDTPGTNPFRTADAAMVGALGSPARAQLLAVLPAGLDPAEAADLAAGYAALGAAMMAATRLDLARRMGGILSAARAGLTLVEAGIGPGAADGLVPATPDLLARHLLQKGPAPATAEADLPPQ